MYKKIKIVAAAFLILFASAVIITNARMALADNVGQVQTTKYFAPETVNMIKQRIAQGTGGSLLKAGDTISYIITFTPVNNGGNIGAGGYITDYIPPNVQVVGAEYVQPDGLGGYTTVSVGQQSYMPSGWGARGTQVFGAPFAGYPQGAMSQLYADTGIFYSTDPRTALYAGGPPPFGAIGTMPTFQTPTPGAKALQGTNGYLSEGNSGVLPPVPVFHNFWDTMMTYQHASGLAGTVVPGGQGNTPYGEGSAVAGPNTFYQLDYTGAVGPWNRIAYPGSMIGQGLPATAAGIPEINGVPTSIGLNLSPSNPLPLNTNAVRFSFGRLQVGQFNYVKITLKLLADPSAGGLQNNSEVMGGDSADTDITNTTFISGGKDSVWKYAEGSVADNNSGFYILKEIVAVNGVPSTGQQVNPNDVIKYRITYINTGVQPVYAQFEDFMLTGLIYKAGSAVTLSGTNVFPVAPTFAASGTPPFNGTSAVFPATPILVPIGGGGSFQLEGTVAAAPANPFVDNAIYVRYGTTSTALTNTQQSIAVSNVSIAGATLPPNITQSKTAFPNSISPGSSTVYTITVNNTGVTVGGATVAQAQNSTITDTLPAGFSYVSGTTAFTNSGTPVSLPAPSVVTNAQGRQVVTWSIPAGVQIASGSGVWKVTFSAVTAPAVLPNTYKNDFNSHIYYWDAGQGAGTFMDTATYQTAPVTVSKTRLVKSTSTPTVYMTSNGAVARYSITLYNENPSALSNVNITDTLPAGFSYKAGTASSSINGGAVAAIPSGNITTGASTVSFNMGTLAANSFLTIDFDVNIATSANIGTNNNTVSGTADIAGTPVTIPPYTGATVNIQPQGLVVNKFVSDSLGNALPAGQNGVPFTPVAGATAASVYTASKAVYYTIELINSGNTYANNVGVSESLPMGFVYPATTYNPLVLYRQSVNGVITALPTPASTPVNDAAKTYTVMPKWSTFSIPPQQNGVSSKILITFPVDVRQNTGGGALPVDVLKSATQYQNTVSADGANNIFSGAPVDVYNPINKVSVTKTVVRGSNATYTVNVLNNTSSSYMVNIADTIKNAANVTQNWPFVSDTLAGGWPGFTRPGVGAVGILNWTNIVVPVGGLSFNFTVTVPAAQAAAVYHNTATVTIGGIPTASSTYNGVLAANTGDDVNVVLTALATPPTLMKNTLNGTSVLGPFTIASSPAPVYVNTGGKIWYELVIQNNASTSLSIGNTTDTLPTGFSIVAGDRPQANHIIVIRPKNSISGTIAGANVSVFPNASKAAITFVGQTYTITTATATNLMPIPASTAAVPQGFEMAIIFRATVGAAATPVTPGQYSNTFTVNDPVVTNPALGSYNGALTDVAPVRIAKTIDPASSTIMAGQTTSYTIELTNTNTTPVTFIATKPLTVTDYLPYKTVAGVIPAASPVVFASTTSVYTYNPVTALNTNVVPTTQPAATPPYTTANPVWTFQNLTIPAASNGISGKLVIVFTASTSATAAVDGQYLNTVGDSFLDPVQNYTTAALTETDTFSGATLTISTITVTKTASVSFVTQTPQGASTSYQIRIQNPGTTAVTLAVSENLPFGFVYNPVAGASQSTATAVYVNRTTQASGAVSAANIRNSNGVGALAAPNSQFYIASTAAALFAIPANTDLYINLNNIYIQPTVANGTYYNSLTTKNAAGLVIDTLNNTAPVTVGAPYVLINKTTTTPIVSKNTVNAGTAIVHYDITLTNMGNASATNVILTDLLPRLTPAASPAATAYPVIIASSTVISVTNNAVTTVLPAASYSATQPAASNAITFTSLAPAGGFTIPAASGGNNGILTVGFDVSIPSGADIGTYYNTVNASTSNAGTISYVSGSPFSITAFGLVKSVVAINGNTGNITNISPGDTVSYNITAFNTGPNNMPNLNITDVLPGGFTYVVGSANVTNSFYAPAIASIGPMEPVGTTTLVWSPIPTASNGSVIITFNALVGAGVTPGTYYNVASVNDGGSQTVSTGNTAPVTMSNNPQMGIVKTVENASRTLPNNGSVASPGETLRYTITASVSVTTAYNIYVIDNIDPAIAYVSGSEVLNNMPATLTFKNVEYYDRTTPTPVLISSTTAFPATRTVNPAIGRVIYRFNGTLAPPNWFRIIMEAIVQ